MIVYKLCYFSRYEDKCSQGSAAGLIGISLQTSKPALFCSACFPALGCQDFCTASLTAVCERCPYLHHYPAFIFYSQICICKRCLPAGWVCSVHVEMESSEGSSCSWGNASQCRAWDVAMPWGAAQSQPGECTSWPGSPFLFLQNIFCFPLINQVIPSM